MRETPRRTTRMTTILAVDPSDVAAPDRDKALDTLRRVQLEEVRDPDGPAFAEAFEMLDGFFGPLGELETRETLAGFVRARRCVYADGLEGTYHLVTARVAGELVGVRDCYVDVDHHAGVCVVGLAHAYVAPMWRRSGLAALLRTVPLTLAREASRQRGRDLPTLVVAEMEPADPASPDTVVRLLAYGRSGFGVLDPRRFRYSQAEFRDLPDARHTGMAMLGVVRPLNLPPGPLPVDVVASFPRIFYATHRGFVPAARVDPSEHHLMSVLGASPEPVPLLPLPISVPTLDRLAPLVRGAVLPLFPPELRGEDPVHGDPAEEMTQILTSWR